MELVIIYWFLSVVLGKDFEGKRSWPDRRLRYYLVIVWDCGKLRYISDSVAGVLTEIRTEYESRALPLRPPALTAINALQVS
jgi:hypothetical protein